MPETTSFLAPSKVASGQTKHVSNGLKKKSESFFVFVFWGGGSNDSNLDKNIIKINDNNMVML